MTASANDILLSDQNGYLHMSYSSSQQIHHFSHRVNNQATPTLFAFSQTWINGQPADCLRKFEFEVLKKEDLKMYEIVDTSLFLSVPKQELLFVKVQFLKEEKDFRVSPKLTIAGLKKVIQRELKIDDFELELEKGSTLTDLTKVGKVLEKIVIRFKEDPNEKLEEEDQEAGLEFDLKMIDFVDFKHAAHLKFSKNAKEGRTIDKGMNLEGECQNPKCNSQKSTQKWKVCAQLHFSHPHFVQISKEVAQVHCPICDTQLKNVKNIIFWDCIYSIEGTTEYNKPIKHLDMKAPTDEALTFCDSLPGTLSTNIIKWKALKIKTMEIPVEVTSQVSILRNCIIL